MSAGLARRAARMLGAAAAVALLLSGPSPAPAAFQGHNGRVAYVRDGSIWVMNADGSSPAQLAANGFDPAWKPDGVKIAFTRGGSIWVMNANGSAQTQLAANATEPAWSPDGSKIAFQRSSSWLLGDIGVMNADGSNQTMLATNAADPAWSPDGVRIAFTRGVPGGREIYVMNANGSDPTQLTRSQESANTTGYSAEPAWSPNGSKIAYARVVQGTDWTASGAPPCSPTIWAMNADGSNPTPQQKPPPDVLEGCPYWSDYEGKGFSAVDGTSPTWSPDSTRILFSFWLQSWSVDDQLHAGPTELETMGPDGGGGTNLTHSTASEFEPDWQPLTPGTWLTGHPPVSTTSGSATFSFGGSGSTFECHLGPLEPSTVSFEPCTSPKSYSGFDAGTHTFAVRAVDGAGYHDPTPATWTWKSVSTLTVSVSGPGKVTSPIFSGNRQIGCGNGETDCTSDFVGGAVTLTAKPASGATFVGWGGACSGTAPACTVQMTTSKSVTARFQAGGIKINPPSAPTLTVSVSGPGKVTGAGINCGNGATSCTAAFHPGTLTATPAGGATFKGWGGNCSGSAPTCTLGNRTTDAKVTATFQAPGPTSLQKSTLTVSVSGPGTVTGGGIDCGNGASTCSAKPTTGSSVTLTATPASGASFAHWGGACSGSGTTCTLTLNASTSVSAAFSGGTSPGGGTSPANTLEGLGAPVVAPTAHGFSVTLRISTPHAGTVRITAFRAGRSLLVVPVHVAAGPATVGPFTLAKAGLYTFQVRMGTSAIRLQACLGGCFSEAPAPPFVLTGKIAKKTRSGHLWSVTLWLHANQISDGLLQVLRGSKVRVGKHRLAPAGAFGSRFRIAPGRYTVRFSAIDPYGRVRTLSWTVTLDH